jgi:hypothetical protein
MTQQEISTYFRDAGYTENPEYTFVDPTGQFTFVSGPEQLIYTYTEYEGVIKNENISGVPGLEQWINLVEQDSLNPPI